MNDKAIVKSVAKQINYNTTVTSSDKDENRWEGSVVIDKKNIKVTVNSVSHLFSRCMQFEKASNQG
ncbi:hypothetical protein FGF66_07615 [Chlorobaculum thiosulfatiphilum]|uniref:Uncharacterized protein n=1 Tax=Chlorobaculum thiosulfatiphilum TaxID=115852 RepID=A0A5C4S7I3_CHLTI|nr:hypothetical protein [Chlorobaculum thiosulfatiphilum]TNJ38711.1 hypothetical protein FGF66_07615 [Chlorobaculum thiosulfatiphilum]